MTRGWLLEGLLEARREADENPKLRELVERNPSGYLNELQKQKKPETT
jgi:hypothetical protein